MREVTASGQTVEEAIESALVQLNIEKDQADVEVIDEGKKGFLGLFGSSLAIVKVSEKQAKEEALNEVDENQTFISENEADDDEEVSVEKTEGMNIEESIHATEVFLTHVATNMGIDISIETSSTDQQVTFDLSGDKIGMLIGKRGKTLNALQYLTQLVLNKDSASYLTVVVDAEGYRARRKETLEDLSFKMRDKALRLDTKVALEPMSAYERKIIHSALQEHDDVTTYSDGKEPHRHIVIAPK